MDRFICLHKHTYTLAHIRTHVHICMHIYIYLCTEAHTQDIFVLEEGILSVVLQLSF